MVDDSKNRNSLIFFLLSCVFLFLQWGLPLLGFNSINFGWILIIAAFICGAIALFVWRPSFKLSLFFKIVIVAVVGIIYFGSIIYYKNEPQKQITPPVDKDKSVGKSAAEPAPPPSPSEKRVQKSESKTEDRPYFVVQIPEIKIKPQLQLGIYIKNIHKHTAFNLHGSQIIVDQQFKLKPSIVDVSQGNEIPTGIPYFFNTGLKPIFLTLNHSIKPFYVIFAFKYQDQESSLKMPPQIWYFKTTQAWVEEENPPIFSDVEITERENIFNHLKHELKDYLK